jgi:hypothetical protein
MNYIKVAWNNIKESWTDIETEWKCILGFWGILFNCDDYCMDNKK